MQLDNRQLFQDGTVQDLLALRYHYPERKDNVIMISACRILKNGQSGIINDAGKDTQSS